MANNFLYAPIIHQTIFRDFQHKSRPGRSPTRLCLELFDMGYQAVFSPLQKPDQVAQDEHREGEG